MSKAVKNKVKLNDVVSVKDFGAVGDGVTDDTSAIQTCINANQTAQIVFPSGTYKVSSAILLTDSSGHNFQGSLVGQKATITFINTGASTDTDAAMQHGFQAYPVLLAQGGDITGLQGVVISGFSFVGPTNGACVYIANSLGVVFQNNKTTGSRYGLVMECCIQTKIINNEFNNYTNAGVGAIMSGNTSKVYYGYSGGSVNGNINASYWNDGLTIQGNIFQTSATNYTLAHILDYGSQSESIRFVVGNSFYSNYNGSSTFYGTQYGYVGRNCNVTLTSNWFENVNYPVRILCGNSQEAATLNGVTGAQPSGTFSISTIPDGFSFFGTFTNNFFARGLVDINLNGITGGPSIVGQNISQFLQNTGTHLYSAQQSSQMVQDSGDSIQSPVGSYTYASIT